MKFKVLGKKKKRVKHFSNSLEVDRTAGQWSILLWSLFNTLVSQALLVYLIMEHEPWEEWKDHLWLCCVRQEMPFLGQIDIQGSELLQGVYKTKSPPFRSWRHNDKFRLLSYEQKFLLPSRALMAWDFSDRRDIGREIWPRICINISSNTVHYECPWCGVREDRCSHLRQKDFKAGVLCIKKS